MCLQMLSPLMESELEAAWRRVAGQEDTVALEELQHLLSGLQHGLGEQVQ